jgi:AAA family ATP:ADP antiporter
MKRRVRQGRKRFEQLLDLRPGESPALAVAFVYFFCLLCAYYVLRPVRDEMGVKSGVDELQWLFTATFGAMLAAVPLYGWVVRRFPRRRFIPYVYGFFILNVLAFAVAFRIPGYEIPIARAFYVWVSVFNLFVVSVFWSFMADLFTTEQGKRLFGAIAAGGTAGAIAGPSMTAVLAEPLSTATLLLVSVAFLSVTLVCVRVLPRLRFRDDVEIPHERDRIGGSVVEGVTTFFRSRYLLGIGLYIFLFTWTSTFLYFQQADIVGSAFADGGERTRVFALIDLATNVLTLTVQLVLTARILSWGGARAGLSILPVVTVVGFTALAAGPLLWTLATFQVARRGSNYALARPGRELLFTLVPRAQKYKSKSFIDTVVYRGGDAVTGWLYTGLAALGLELTGLAAVAVPVAVLWLGLGWMLGKRADRAQARDARP